MGEEPQKRKKRSSYVFRMNSGLVRKEALSVLMLHQRQLWALGQCSSSQLRRVQVCRSPVLLITCLHCDPAQPLGLFGDTVVWV